MDPSGVKTTDEVPLKNSIVALFNAHPIRARGEELVYFRRESKRRDELLVRWSQFVWAESRIRRVTMNRRRRDSSYCNII